MYTKNSTMTYPSNGYANYLPASGSSANQYTSTPKAGQNQFFPSNRVPYTYVSPEGTNAVKPVVSLMTPPPSVSTSFSTQSSLQAEITTPNNTATMRPSKRSLELEDATTDPVNNNHLPKQPCTNSYNVLNTNNSYSSLPTNSSNYQY